MHDLNRATGDNPLRNSRCGQCLYRQTEDSTARKKSLLTVRTVRPCRGRCLDWLKNTLKIGIMDEERRTTINLQECIRGSEVSALFSSIPVFSIVPGTKFIPAWKPAPVAAKPDAIKNDAVDSGLRGLQTSTCGSGLRACGGVAQIGKGMWAMPDAMRADARD